MPNLLNNELVHSTGAHNVCCRDHNKYEGGTDMAMAPAGGLRPRKIGLDDVRPDPRRKFTPHISDCVY